MRTIFRAAAAILLSAVLSPAARLTPPAERAFTDYTAAIEARLARQHARPDTYVTTAWAAAPGNVHIEPVNGGTWQIRGGLLHHWRAAALVPGATAGDLLTLLRDYDHLASFYAPEMVSSRKLSGGDADATIAIRFRKQAIITVVLDTEFETRSALSGNAGYSFSRSTHVWQVDQPGSPRERRRPEGADDGYLWRLNSYWSFQKRPDGLLMECEAVSLSRDVPAGLGWLILPIVESLPRASLEFTMSATRKALAAGSQRRPHDAHAN